MHSEIEKRVERAIAEKVFPGCVVGTVRSDGTREVMPFGNRTYEPGSPKVAGDTVYDVASITKSIPTASLASLLLQEKKLSLTDKAVAYLPELKNNHGATVEDLLRYRVHGQTLSTLKEKSAEEILEYIFAHGFDAPPSGEVRYTNLPALFLGLIVERVGGDTLDALAQKRFFEPLGMVHTGFFPNVRLTKSNIVPTEVVDGKEVCGIVHDESARVFALRRRAVGHAGLFSSAPDLLTFFEALLQGKYPKVVEGAREGLGWQTEGAFLGNSTNSGTFGKTGFTGTSCVCDIERPGRAGPGRADGIAFVILSNRTYPQRPPDGDAINAFRADIADIFLH